MMVTAEQQTYSSVQIIWFFFLPNLFAFNRANIYPQAKFRVMLKREKKLEREIALSRIEKLIEMAEKMKFEDYELSKRCVTIARKIAMKYRVRIPKELRNFCKKCLYPYRHDRMRVRVRKNRVVITCLNCGYVKRVPLKKG